MNHVPTRPSDPATTHGQAPDRTETLAAAAAQGDSDALGQLYDLYFDKTYRVALVRVGSVAAAQDVTHDAWVTVVAKISTYKARGGGWPAWLFTILRSRINDHYRATTRARYDLDNDAGTDRTDLTCLDPHTEAERLETCQMIAAVLAALPPHYTDVLTARFWMGLSTQETAVMLGVTVGTVKIRQHRAVKLAATLIQPA